jgi:hypothetical protein
MSSIRKSQSRQPGRLSAGPSTGAGHPQQTVAERAYQIWEASGRPDGHDQEHWLRAEQELGRSSPRTTS